SSELNNTFAPQRYGRTQSVGIKNSENTQSRIAVPLIVTPSPKLFVKSSPKSNRSLIINAIQYSIFPGAVSSEQRIKVQESLARSDAKHFLILFRDQKCQYRGLYTWDTTSDHVHKIHGVGPKVCKGEMLALMF
uniref:CKK domain-containing protein n=1 Tax=Acrobeloides nanus TaxID=290746 RepID=A0A914DFQ0_9BILA